MTVLQVAERLHVDPRVLEALETERFEQLGAPVYVRGHLKRYAELVGENATQLLEEYTAISKPVLPDLTQLPKASRQADPRRLVLPSLVVLIAFALVGTVWWVLQSLEGKAAFGPPVAPHIISPTSPVEGTGAASAETAAGTSPAPSSSEVAPETTSTQDDRNRATEAGGTAASPQPVQTSSATPAEPARAGSVDVTLKFSADSWVEVYDANGQRLFYDIGSADSSRTLSGAPPLRVVLGNAPGVLVNINGKAATVPPSVLRDDVAQFTINRSGRIVRTRPEAAAVPESKPNGE